ncbi:MAG: PP2C family protein-serine/threonine phosphatase [Cytophagaceae bacterium]
MIPKPQLSGKEELEKTIHLKELELNSLLEVTQAINSNLPESSLYKIFQFTLIANLQIQKLALFVLDDYWECKVCYGLPVKLSKEFITEDILCLKSIAEVKKSKGALDVFDVVITILHKEKILAYVFVGDTRKNQEKESCIDLSFVQTLSSILLVAIENKKFSRKELQQEALKKELSIARDVQSQFIPKELPSTDRISIKATYLPHQTIGGDYYDYIEIDKDKFLICIADVSGKGIPAALLMSNFQASLRALIRQTNDLIQIFHELNHLTMNNSKGERFITFFAAICDLDKKEIEYINAGHNPSVLISGNGEETLLDKGTTILGAFPQLPFIEKQVVGFTAGSILLTYTDGITETINHENEEFGFDRLKAFISKKGKYDAAELHENILKELDVFRGDNVYADDISMLTCYFK